MEGICVIQYFASRFQCGGKVMEYVGLIRDRSSTYISTTSELQLANVVMAVWAIYYNRPISDDEAFVDSLARFAEEDIAIINALILMVNVSPENLSQFGLSEDEAVDYCEEFPQDEQLHCKAVSKLYGVMKDSPKMRAGLRKLYKHISTHNNETLVLDIDKFHEEA